MNNLDVSYSYKARNSKYTTYNMKYSNSVQFAQQITGDYQDWVYSKMWIAANRAVNLMHKRVNRSKLKHPHLQDTVFYSVEKVGLTGVVAKIVAPAPYAVFLEYGTSKMSARPFFRNSLIESFNGFIGASDIIRAVH